MTKMTFPNFSENIFEGFHIFYLLDCITFCSADIKLFRVIGFGYAFCVNTANVNVFDYFLKKCALASN